MKPTLTLILAFLLPAAANAGEWSLFAEPDPEPTNYPPLFIPAAEPESDTLTIRVYSAPVLESCPACVRMKAERDQIDGVKWTEHEAPDWVEAYPTLHWQSKDGTWKKHKGWDIDEVRQKIAYENPQFASRNGMPIFTAGRNPAFEEIDINNIPEPEAQQEATSKPVKTTERIIYTQPACGSCQVRQVAYQQPERRRSRGLIGRIFSGCRNCRR